MPNIGVRAGHEGAVTGSKGTSGNGLVEKTMNVDVAKKLIVRLKDHGFTVYKTTGDLGSKLYSYYNKYLSKNDLLLSVHHNGYIPSAKGSEVLISIAAKTKAKKHANMLLDLFVKEFGTKSRGIVQRESESNPGYDFYGIIKGTVPKVILGEPLFLTNKDDTAIVKANYTKFIDKQVECYVKVACSWYGIKYKSNVPTVPEPQPTDPTIEELKKDIENLSKKVEDNSVKIIRNRQAIDKILSDNDKIEKLIKFLESYDKEV